MADIRELLSDMRDYGLRRVDNGGGRTEFSSVSRLEDQQETLAPDCLYVGSVSQISGLKKTQGGILLLTQDIPMPEKNAADRCVVILSDVAQNSDVLFARCSRWLEEYKYYLEAANRLMQTFLSYEEGMLKRLVNQAAEFLHNPLVVLDANCKVLSASENYAVEDGVWLENLARGYCSYEQIIELQGLANAQMKEGRGESLVVSSAFSDNRLCIGNLNTPDEKMGMLLAFEENTPFSKMNRRLFLLAVRLITRTIHADYEKAQTLNEYSEDNIFIECLSGELKSYASYRERIRNTRFSRPSRYCVILIDVDKFENFDPRKEILREYFQTLFQDSWMLWYRGHVVAVADTGNTENLEAALLRGREFFEERSLRLGISDEFTNIYYIETYYRQGLTALRLSGKLHPGQMFAWYGQYRFFDMLDVVMGQPAPQRFLDRKIREMREYDETNHTEYYDTVQAFVLSGQNLNRAAARLHVHKNTVSYRIKKARELFALEFDSEEALFRLAYSFRLKRLLDVKSEESGEDTERYPADFLC